MNIIFLKIFKITFLFLFLINFQLFFVDTVMAEKCEVEPKGWIEFNISPSNYSGAFKNVNEVSFSISIVNIKDINLDMPFRWIQNHSIQTKFINLENKKATSLVLGSPRDFYKDGLLNFDPSTTATFFQRDYDKVLKSIINKRPADILAIVNVSTYVYYAGSTKPIGSYINGKFEPTLFSCTKQFHIKIQ